MRTYLIKSQLCDWNTQTMVTDFALKAIESAEKGEDFPLAEIARIATEKKKGRSPFPARSPKRTY